MSPAERHTLFVAMVTTLVQLHVLDWRGMGLEDFGGRGDYVKRQVRNSTILVLVPNPSPSPITPC